MNSYISDLLIFIEKSLELLEINSHKKSNDFIILIPFKYKYPIREYIEYLSDRDFIINDSFKYKGVECRFISPDSKCYVFVKDYIMYSQYYENKFWFSINLN